MTGVQTCALPISYAPGEPIGLILEQDDLSFYPIIYWAIEPKASQPSVGAVKALSNYLTRGGTIIFDTHDANNHYQANGKSAEQLHQEVEFWIETEMRVIDPSAYK